MTKLDINKLVDLTKIGVKTGVNKGTTLKKYLDNKNPIYNLAIASNINVGTTEITLPLVDGNFKAFKIENGVIKIGKNISLVRICATISIQNTTSTGGQRRINLKKNSDIINASYCFANNAIYNNATAVLNKIIEVTEGDILSLSAISNSGNCIILTDSFSNMYIEKLK